MFCRKEFRLLSAVGVSLVSVLTAFHQTDAAEVSPAGLTTGRLVPASVVPVAGTNAIVVAQRSYGGVRSYGAYRGRRGGVSYSLRFGSPYRYGSGYGLSSYRYSPRSYGYRFYGTGISAYYNRPYYYGGLYSPNYYSYYSPRSYGYSSYVPRYYGYSSYLPSYGGYSAGVPYAGYGFGYAPYNSYSVYAGGAFVPSYYSGYYNMAPNYYSAYGYGCAPY